jgi:hypothetical protein
MAPQFSIFITGRIIITPADGFKHFLSSPPPPKKKNGVGSLGDGAIP